MARILVLGPFSFLLRSAGWLLVGERTNIFGASAQRTYWSIMTPMNWTFFAHFAKSWSFLSGLSKTSPYPHWTGTALSHTGRVRSSNQDAFAVDNHLGLWVVADGMGGHAGGNIASDIAVSIITKEVRSALAGIFTHKYRAESQRADILREAVAAAGAEIQKRASREPQLSGMGTTDTAALCCSHPSTSVIIGHLGDSRAYLIRRQTIAALTTDHSLVVDLLRAGKLTEVEARNHPQRHVLSNALGLTGHSAADIAAHPLEPNDQLLLCTDGLTKMLSETEILAAILTPGLSDAERCGALIDHANRRGGEDNTTVLLITPASHST